MASTGVDQYKHSILLKDVAGERVKSSIKKYLWGKENREDVKILRGELISLIAPRERPDGKPPHNCCLQRDHNVTFYTIEDDVAPLSYSDYKLLAAIETPWDRFTTFVADYKLEWGNKLQEGDEVYVCLPGHDSNPLIAEWSQAVIQYKGAVKSLPGTQFGVEIIDDQYRGRGSTNGWFQDKKFFQCENNCGLFVSLDKLEPHSPRSYANIARPQQTKIESSVDVPKPQDSLIAVNDRVIVYNTKGIANHGFVRWIGNKTKTGSLGATYVGIETDATVYTADFYAALPGMSSLFRAKPNHNLLVPLSHVVKEVVHASANVQHGTQDQRSNPHHRSAPGKIEAHRSRYKEDHIDVHNQIALAKELGTTRRRLMYEQDKVLEEGKQAKRAKAKAKKSETYKEVKDAMLGETITADDQQKILDAIKRGNEKRQSAHGGKGTPPQSCGTMDPSRQDSSHSLTKQRSLQDHHIYEPIPGDSLNARCRFADQGKAASADLLQGPHGQYQDQHSGTQQPDQFQRNQQHPGPGQQPWVDDNTHRRLHQLPAHQCLPQQMQRLSSTPQLQGVSAVIGPPGDDLSTAIALGFEEGSTIQIQLPDPTQPPRYGVIKWIGKLPGIIGQVAGIELEEYMEGCTDGTWQQTRYFECPQGKGMFYLVNNLKRDERLTQTENTLGDVQVLQKQLSQEKKERESLQQQLTSKNEQLQSENNRLIQESTEFKEQLTQQRLDFQEEKEKMINTHSQAEQLLHSQLKQMETRLQQLQQQQQQLQLQQQQLQNASAGEHYRSSTQLIIPPQDQDSWNVARDQVKIIGEIGRGAWGVVLKGRFRDQPVAVKQVHSSLLQQAYTIPQMKREIQIMASVQHPNLVRFIAAVIDDKVDRGEETPLLVVELLDMDLRQAYKTTDLGTNKIPIFRDVAYALHYLHEHQEPIIHRDLSAANVLLESLQGGMYRAKLSDFGSANKVKDARTAGPGAICYSAPETFPPVDLRAPVPPQTPKIDVYSYGILLAEVITEIMPTTENRGQLLREVQQTWTLMYDLICSCTMPNPSDRPTMVNILNTLNRIPTARPRQVSK